ncbi:cytochrome P460 family protein [Mesorhizobium opportunistum]|uniref:cytochrome P460 family protein n=1 Tax=Mesorhizobium opportunistum TaxID=593909 RepID=UPI00333CDCC6
MRTNKLWGAALLCGVAVTFVGARSQPETPALPQEARIKLTVPTVDYRTKWVSLGSFSLLSDEPDKGAKQLHVVYTQPESVEAYLKTGTFPDGTVLIKDVYGTKTEDLTTGRSSYADTLIGRFVMVKDKSNKRASVSPLWGDGWGWAFYEGAETQKTVTTDYRGDCLSCHEPARNQGLVYTQGYPILRSARQ